MKFWKRWVKFQVALNWLFEIYFIGVVAATGIWVSRERTIILLHGAVFIKSNFNQLYASIIKLFSQNEMYNNENKRERS